MAQLYKKPRRKILYLVVLVFVVSIPLVYFFVLRPSDGDYQKSLSLVKTLRKTTEDVKKGLTGVEHMIQIGNTTHDNLNKLSKSYSDALDELSKSPAVTRDAKVAAVYEKHVSALDEYGEQLKNLNDSINAYILIAKSCGSLDDVILSTNKTHFNKAMQDCQDSVKASESAPDKVFNTAFLNDYRTEADKLATKYRLFFDAQSKAAISAASEAANEVSTVIIQMGNREFKTDLKNLSPEVFGELNETLKSRQNVFLR